MTIDCDLEVSPIAIFHRGAPNHPRNIGTMRNFVSDVAFVLHFSQI